MATRSYAGANWLLFVRTNDDNDDIVFTALITRRKNAMAERIVDTTALLQHSEEIGIEMETIEFKPLLLKTLEKRQNVDLVVEFETESETIRKINLLVTYKFSPTISRKGVFRLPVIAADTPVSLVALLTSFHAMPPYPILSEEEQREKVEKGVLLSALKSRAIAGNKSAGRNEENGGAIMASQNAVSTSATTALDKPGLLKKRLIPAGTMRRKGPRGAKLAKK